jgi:hypothetical protein
VKRLVKANWKVLLILAFQVGTVFSTLTAQSLDFIGLKGVSLGMTFDSALYHQSRNQQPVQVDSLLKSGSTWATIELNEKFYKERTNENLALNGFSADFIEYRFISKELSEVVIHISKKGNVQNAMKSFHSYFSEMNSGQEKKGNRIIGFRLVNVPFIGDDFSKPNAVYCSSKNDLFFKARMDEGTDKVEIRLFRGLFETKQHRRYKETTGSMCCPDSGVARRTIEIRDYSRTRKGLNFDNGTQIGVIKEYDKQGKRKAIYTMADKTKNGKEKVVCHKRIVLNGKIQKEQSCPCSDLPGYTRIE